MVFLVWKNMQLTSNLSTDWWGRNVYVLLLLLLRGLWQGGKPMYANLCCMFY